MTGNIKQIGLISATSLVVGNMIGSGIFLLPSALAEFGGISILGWVLSGTGALFLAFVFARLARIHPMSGGPYAYSRAAFGDFTGFLAGWGYWISVWCANASIAVTLVSYLSIFIPAVTSSGFTAAACAIAMIWLFSIINLRGVKTGASVQVVTTILKIIPILLISLVGLFFIQPDHFVPFNLSERPALSAITSSAALTLFAFLGVECATIPAQSVKNPTKTIPQATIIGTILVLLVYVLSTVSVFGIVGPGLIDSGTPFADAAEPIFSRFGVYLVAFGAVASTAGALNGWTLIQGQIPMAMSEDRLFPKLFSVKNPSNAPVYGLIWGSLIVSVLILFNFTKGLVGMFTFMILLSTFTVLISYLFSSLAEPMIKIKEKAPIRFEDIRTPLMIGIPAFIYSVWMVYGAGGEIVLNGFIMILTGVPLYLLTKFKTRKDSDDQL